MNPLQTPDNSPNCCAVNGPLLVRQLVILDRSPFRSPKIVIDLLKQVCLLVLSRITALLLLTSCAEFTIVMAVALSALHIGMRPSFESQSSWRVTREQKVKVVMLQNGVPCRGDLYTARKYFLPITTRWRTDVRFACTFIPVRKI